MNQKVKYVLIFLAGILFYFIVTTIRAMYF